MGKGKKLTYEEVKNFINSLGYELLSKEYLRNEQKLILRDDEGYLYSTSINNLKNNRMPNKFNKSNPYTIQNIKLWCKLNNKPYELISDTYIKVDTNLYWKCLKDNCKGIFKMSWENIHNHGCSFCSNKEEGGCLATKNSELAKEWHPTLNGELTPYHIAFKSGLEVWWQCPNNPEHKWQAKIYSRNNGNNCPYCAGHYSSDDYNLLLDNPELCKEWNYERNNKEPEEYTPNSNEKVWWKCLECGHKWDTYINHRNRKDGKGTGCPECNKSKGEKRCKEYFDLRNVYYIPQKEFDGLLGLGGKNLSYDFWLPKYNLLIEYQGEYHDGTVLNQTKEKYEYQQEHDRRKKEYALQNKYNFLEIWYYDFDKIEEILKNILT